MQEKLSVERLRSASGWPKLKAKAAMTRHVARFALHLVCERDTNSPRDRRRFAVCQPMVKFCDIGQKEPMFVRRAGKVWKMSPKIALVSASRRRWQPVAGPERPRFWESPKRSFLTVGATQNDSWIAGPTKRRGKAAPPLPKRGQDDFGKAAPPKRSR